uniref:Kinesin light chain n=1 Tax=Cyclophora tenuis TaxID=216820 RepID=A0A7S1D2E4_CYCTE|mmetsp:Transcript_19778/g.33761  ORF Transcript_19778/g.33761 Transcript_19778/m.33761 type:complete len:144 (+) Transcript_19778:160-591(+)|eukprot:CAMPEP_0116562770 /NCGR_PEP_ID=MMETSP0397-20121206/12353_1 /TAXON_ID=216820 /ORGANISM="Cyclophora tenuis, Strain ECT3854" /LENGTH=143 /DNA_ID=CAMNT_0004089121 /DNA_START=135 /DNA_END=566 /DNA_ORIENTATION=+
MFSSPYATRSKPKTAYSRDSDNVVLRQVLDDLRRYRRDLGENHEKVAETWNSLGLIRLHMQRDPEAALGCHQEALKIFRKKTANLAMAITLNDLGYCYERLNQREQALEIYKEAVDLLKKQKLGQSHPRMIATQRSVNRLMRS